ncbi:glycoside hydrolase [Natronospora cellulosivora (SeqCode)]
MANIYPKNIKTIFNRSIILFFLLILFYISFTALLSLSVQANGDAIIYPETEKHLITDWGFDIKGLGDMADRANQLTEDFARKLFVEDGMNVLRVPIFAALGHPEPGVIDKSVYTHVNRAIKNTLNVRSDVKIFASLKLLGQESFPDWVKDDNDNLKPEKYAQLLAEYLQYMNKKNIPIYLLGIDNEREYNEADMTPVDHKRIVDELWRLSILKNFTVPLIVGPETYHPVPNLVRPFNQDGWRDTLDIVGTHYYPRYNPYMQLRRKVDAADGRPVWNTEVHALKGGRYSREGFSFVDQSFVSLFQNFDLGLSGYVWWHYIRDGIRGELQNNVVRSTLGAYTIDMTDFDGRELGEGKFNSRAFRQGNDIVVWVSNFREDLSSYGFELADKSFDGPVSYLQWEEDSSSFGMANITADNRFEMNFPDESVSMIRVHGVYGSSSFEGYGYLWNETSINLSFSKVDDKLSVRFSIAYLDTAREELEEVTLEIESKLLSLDAGQWVEVENLGKIIIDDVTLGEEQKVLRYELDSSKLNNINGLMRVESTINIVIDDLIFYSESINSMLN